MAEIFLYNAKVVDVSDLDGVLVITQPGFAEAARVAKQGLGEGVVGQAVFNLLSQGLYLLQPPNKDSIDGTKVIHKMLGRGGRELTRAVFSNRPSEHEWLTRKQLYAIGVDTDQVICFGHDPSSKVEHVRGLMEEGVDVVLRENDPGIALRVAALNKGRYEGTAVAYLFDDQTGGKDRPGLVRVNSFEQVITNLSTKLIKPQ
jgi:hypothetical protein